MRLFNLKKKQINDVKLFSGTVLAVGLYNEKDYSKLFSLSLNRKHELVAESK